MTVKQSLACDSTLRSYWRRGFVNVYLFSYFAIIMVYFCTISIHSRPWNIVQWLRNLSQLTSYHLHVQYCLSVKCFFIIGSYSLFASVSILTNSLELCTNSLELCIADPEKKFDSAELDLWETTCHLVYLKHCLIMVLVEWKQHHNFWLYTKKKLKKLVRLAWFSLWRSDYIVFCWCDFSV